MRLAVPEPGATPASHDLRFPHPVSAFGSDPAPLPYQFPAILFPLRSVSSLDFGGGAKR